MTGRRMVAFAMKRTPIVPQFSYFDMFGVAELLGISLRALMAETSLSHELVNTIIVANVVADAQSAHKRGVVLGGFLEDGPTNIYRVDKVCLSAFEAVRLAALEILGGAECVLTGGAEAMHAKWKLQIPDEEKAVAMCDHLGLLDAGTGKMMYELAEMHRERHGIIRTGDKGMDAYALFSLLRALAARDALGQYIVPVVGKGDFEVTHDIFRVDRSGVEIEVTQEMITGAKPYLGDHLTGFNSSGKNFAGAWIGWATPEFIAKHGLTPIAEYVIGTEAHTKGVDLFDAPPIAIKLLHAELEKNHDVKDASSLMHFLTEAFSPQAIVDLKDSGVAWENANPFGGSLWPGHPIGPAGLLRYMEALAYMKLHPEVIWTIISACGGGGEAVAGAVKKFEATGCC